MEAIVNKSRLTRTPVQIISLAPGRLGCMYRALGYLSGELRDWFVFSPCFVHDRRFAPYTRCLASIGYSTRTARSKAAVSVGATEGASNKKYHIIYY